MKKKIKEFLLLVKKELAICIAVPILTAVLLCTDVPQNQNYFPMIAIALFCAFAYGIIKMFYVLKKKETISNDTGTMVARPKSTKYRIFVLIVAVVMPVAGLMLNNGFDVRDNNGGIFGDFSNIWFYIIAVSNGLVLLLDIKDDRRSLLLFYLKIVGFAYISYFALIFVPYVPFGVIGLIFYGLGIFAFVPAAVFVIEILQILQDIKILKTKYMTRVVAAIVLGAVTIPAALAINFAMDKINFNKALTYLSADSQKTPAVNIARLDATLGHISHVLGAREANRGILGSGSDIPIISKVYQTVVFDDKIISPDTARRLNQIFFGKIDDEPIDSGNDQFQNVNLSKFGTSSDFDESIGVYKTWVDLEIKNDSGRALSEYRTEFLLPEGCFVKDYYLYVGQERKQGILADRRAALITYENIIRTPKDPGIIYFKNDNTIELRVYPFGANQTRKTGFQVWHSQNEIIIIDGKEIHLTAKNSTAEPMDMPGISFVPASCKKNLKQHERTPKYYFVIDASGGSPFDEHLKKVQDFVNCHKITDAEIYAASYKVYDANQSAVKCEGGFNLPIAMEKIFKEYEKSDLWFPVIIAVSDNINKAPDFQKSNMAKQFPESEYYYNLGYDLSLTPYSFSDGKRHDIVKTPIISKALDYNGFAVADNGKSEIVLTGDFGGYTADEYQNAFILYGKNTTYTDDGDTQTELVRDSFRQRVLTKHTSFTVLETKEQENSLLELQAKFLSGDKNAAPAVMMDEPNPFVCAVLIFASVFFGKIVYNKKNTKQKGMKKCL